jgi:hypothetical protein
MKNDQTFEAKTDHALTDVLRSAQRLIDKARWSHEHKDGDALREQMVKLSKFLETAAVYAMDLYGNEEGSKLHSV